MCGLGEMAMGIVYLARMELHPLFIQAFGGDKELLAWAQTLRESWTRWFAQSIEEPKSEEARGSDEAAGRLCEEAEKRF